MVRALAYGLPLSICWSLEVQAVQSIACTISAAREFDATLSHPVDTPLKNRILKIAVEGRRMETCAAEDDQDCVVTVIPAMRVQHHPAFTSYQVQWTETKAGVMEKYIIAVVQPPADSDDHIPSINFYRTRFEKSGNDMHLSGTSMAEGLCVFR